MKEKEGEWGRGERRRKEKKRHVGSDRLTLTNNSQLILWHLAHMHFEAGKPLLLKDSASMTIAIQHKSFIISNL